MYAVNRSSPKHKQAQECIKTQKRFGLFHQNIFESLRMLTHPKFSSSMKTADAVSAIRPIISSANVFSPVIETYAIALELLTQALVIGNKIVDVYLIASMLSHNQDTIATDNEKDFKLFGGIHIVNPFQ